MMGSEVAMSTPNIQKPLLGVAISTALLLGIPAIAMQFTPEVSWGPGDFLAAAILLFGAGTLIVLSRNHVTRPTGRIAWTLGVLIALALVWAELAVGIFS
jgi:hypothetical protein